MTSANEQQSPASTRIFGDAEEQAYADMNALAVAELCYIARWLALRNPELAQEGMAALAKYKRLYPDAARHAGMPVTEHALCRNCGRSIQRTSGADWRHRGAETQRRCDGNPDEAHGPYATPREDS